MADSTPSKFAQKQDEPLFMAVPQTDSDFKSAYDRAAATIAEFIEHIQQRFDGAASRGEDLQTELAGTREPLSRRDWVVEPLQAS